jgi:hypothetical protein
MALTVMASHKRLAASQHRRRGGKNIPVYVYVCKCACLLVHTICNENACKNKKQ